MVSVGLIRSGVNVKDQCQALEGVPQTGFTQTLLSSLGKDVLLIQSVLLGSDRSPNSESTPIPQTHIDIQDLVSGTLSQKGLPRSAGDLVRSFVGEHCPSALVLPRAIDCPVPIDDGAARATSQGCGDKRTSFSGKLRCA